MIRLSLQSGIPTAIKAPLFSKRVDKKTSKYEGRRNPTPHIFSQRVENLAVEVDSLVVKILCCYYSSLEPPSFRAS